MPASSAIKAVKRGKPRLAGEAVYATLKREILSGGGGASEDRLREHDLSKRFGVSRTPVREALKRLAAEGLIGIEPGRGMVVRRPTVEDVIDTYEVHEVVQGLAARLATERSSEVDIFRLETIMNGCQSALKAGNYERAMELTGEFERALRDLSRNGKLRSVITFLHTSLAPTSISDSRVRIQQQLDEHRTIVEAIKKRDPDGAEAASREHSRHSRDHRLRILLGDTTEVAAAEP